MRAGWPSVSGIYSSKEQEVYMCVCAKISQNGSCRRNGFIIKL